MRLLWTRGRSSAGRAPQWHCGGQGFDPPRLHQPSLLRSFGWQASPKLRSSSEGCPPKPGGRRRATTLHYVYVLQSIASPDQYYTGLCEDVPARLAAHNAGQSTHTSKFKPWKLLSAHYFVDERVAAAFERYLKSGSGRAFAAKRLRG